MLFTDLFKEFLLVLGNKLDTLKIISELVQLSKCAGQFPFIRTDKSSGDGIQLDSCVMLKLTKSSCFMVKRDHSFYTSVDPTHCLENNETERNQKGYNNKECDQKLFLN